MDKNKREILEKILRKKGVSIEMIFDHILDEIFMWRIRYLNNNIKNKTKPSKMAQADFLHFCSEMLVKFGPDEALKRCKKLKDSHTADERTTIAYS